MDELDDTGEWPARLGRAAQSVAGPAIGVALVLLIFGVWAPDRFLSADAFGNVFRASYGLAIAAVGATFVIISGGIDLSVGSTMALSCVVTAMCLRVPGMPATAALGAGVLTGLAVGLVNGGLVALVRLPPFIATLATLGAVRGFALFITNGVPISRPTGQDMLLHPELATVAEKFDAIQKLHYDPVAGLAPNIWLALLVVAIGAPLLHWTIVGRYAYAIGSNERTARLCGVRVEFWKVCCYGVAGLCAGLAGAISTAKYVSGPPTEFSGDELTVIAAVVIGGTSLFGGEGTIVGTVLGVLMLSLLKTGCNMAGINTHVQQMFIGGTIVLAAALDRLRHRAG
jgi:ribose transport system permease protein